MSTHRSILVLGTLTILFFAPPAPAQTVEWTRNIAGYDLGGDNADGVTIDPATGDVYASGSTGGDLAGMTAAGATNTWLRKYDPGGNVVWTRQFGAGYLTGGGAVAVDTTGVYVGGSTKGTFPGNTSAGSTDAYVRKYDLNGTELWTWQFGSPSNDSVRDIVTYASFVYVLGHTNGALPGQTHEGSVDLFVAKYDTAGNEIWTRQFGTTVDEDAGRSLGVSAGGVFVGGWTRGALPGQTRTAFPPGLPDTFVRRYDHDGNELWTRQFGTSFYGAHGSAVAADATSVYIAGSTFGTFLGGSPAYPSSDVFLRRYDLSGQEVWTVQSGTTDWTSAEVITVGGSGIFIGGLAGALTPSVTSGPYIRRYDFAGNEIWTWQAEAGPRHHDMDVVGSQLQVVGSLVYNTPTSLQDADAYVKRLDTDGNLVWESELATYKPSHDLGVAVDCNGSPYLTGTTQGTLPGQTKTGRVDAFVTKRNLNGDEVWTRQFGATGGRKEAFANGAAIDDSGILVVGYASSELPGQTNSSGGGREAYVRKYGDDGTELWTHQFGNGLDTQAIAVTTGPGCAYVMGTVYGSLDGQPAFGYRDGFLRKFDSNGNVLWTRQFGTADNGEEARGVAATANAVYVCGYTNGVFDGQVSAGGADAFIIKYDTDGNLIWLKQFGTGGTETANAVAVYQDRLYVGGRAGWNGFVSRLNPATAAEEWSSTVYSGWGLNGLSAAVSGVVAAGFTRGGLALPGQTSSGGEDAFACKYAEDGTELWCLQFGTPGNDRAHGISWCSAGIFVGGQAAGDLEGGFHVPGDTDAFLVKISEDRPPVAVPGENRTVHCQDLVCLDGEESFDDNTPSQDLEYAWQIVGAPLGSAAQLVGDDTSSPCFVVDLLGIYVIELVVTDSLGQTSEPAQMLVSSENLPPTADAGRDAVTYVGSSLQLDGSDSSDPDDDPLTYTWSIISGPTGHQATLTDPNTSTPVFTPDLAGEYEIALGVSDGCAAMPSLDTVMVQVQTVCDYVQGRLVDAIGIIEDLDPSQVHSKGNQRALLRFLVTAQRKCGLGEGAQAENKIRHALERTDGCAERSAPDGAGPGMDWIIDCGPQLQVHAILLDILAAMTP